MDVSVSETIDVPRDRVAHYVMDHRNDTTWIGGIGESELLGDEPFGVGSEVRRVAAFLGKRIEYVLRVVELDPDARLAMRSVQAPFPMEVTYSFSDAPGATIITVRVQGEPSSVYRLAEPVLARQTRRSVGSDLRTLKGLLEGSTGDRGGAEAAG